MSWEEGAPTPLQQAHQGMVLFLGNKRKMWNLLKQRSLESFVIFILSQPALTTLFSTSMNPKVYRATQFPNISLSLGTCVLSVSFRENTVDKHPIKLLTLLSKKNNS